MIILTALGKDPRDVFARRSVIPFAAKSEMVRSSNSGTVKSISIPHFKDSEINLFIRNGDEVHTFTNSNDAIGEIFVKSNNLENCKIILDNIIDNLKIELQ